MPHRHGLSHALATLTCMISASLIAYVIGECLPMRILVRISEKVNSILALPISDYHLSIILLATILAFIWGIGFYFLHTE